MTGVKCHAPFNIPDRVRLVIAVFASDNHWACVGNGLGARGQLHARYLDSVTNRLTAAATLLAEAIASMWGPPLTQFEQLSYCADRPHAACAVEAECHASRLSRHVDELSQVEVDEVEAAIRSAPVAPDLLFGEGGLSEDQSQQLKAILLDRGVPAECLNDRVAAAISKMGAPVLAEALNGRNQWQCLKAAASKPSRAFKWVQPDDKLERHIAERVRTKFGAQVSLPQTKKKAAEDKKLALQSLQVDPTALQIAPKAFVSSGGEPLCQLAFAEIKHQARGIAFCSAAQMAPFAQSYKPMSIEVLGLVSTAVLPTEACGEAPVTTIRYPAIYGPIGEAVFLWGTRLFSFVRMTSPRLRLLTQEPVKSLCIVTS